MPRTTTHAQLPLDGRQLGRPLCLQDPFELDFNTTKSLSARVVAAFQGYMTAAGRMCRSLAQPDAALRPLGMKKDNCAVILGLFELDGLEISMCTEFS